MYIADAQCKCARDSTILFQAHQRHISSQANLPNVQLAVYIYIYIYKGHAKK